ncbi:hypothetical protein GGF32_000297 [Allomyces javanicus]|nr:hypothetical protein GGF32_000297 [Allomyces javanicus]
MHSLTPCLLPEPLDDLDAAVFAQFPAFLLKQIVIHDDFVSFAKGVNISEALKRHLFSTCVTNQDAVPGALIVAQIAADGGALVAVEGAAPYWTAFPTILLFRSPIEALRLKVPICITAVEHVKSVAQAAQIATLVALYVVGLEEAVLAKHHGPLPDCSATITNVSPALLHDLIQLPWAVLPMQSLIVQPSAARMHSAMQREYLLFLTLLCTHKRVQASARHDNGWKPIYYFHEDWTYSRSRHSGTLTLIVERGEGKYGLVRMTVALSAYLNMQKKVERLLGMHMVRNLDLIVCTAKCGNGEVHLSKLALRLAKAAAAAAALGRQMAASNGKGVEAQEKAELVY